MREQLAVRLGEHLSSNLLTEVEASDALRVSVRTLQGWRSQGRGPGYVRLGRAIRYRICDLAEWVDAHRVTP